MYALWACARSAEHAGVDRLAKEKIALAPNNLSAWNYLRGALEHTNTPFVTVVAFVEPYTASEPPAADVVDLDNPLPSAGAQLPCVPALEFLADGYEKEGGEKTTKAVEVRDTILLRLKRGLKQTVQIWKLLANEKDTMRKK